MVRFEVKRRDFRSIGVFVFGFLISAVVCQTAESSTGCRFPGAPAHSNVAFSDRELGQGAVATYECERGFELLGPSRRVCEEGAWLPEGIPFCVLNVAAGKAPMQVSTESGGIPQKAIDGSTSAFFNGETCTLTKPERAPWWYVNLLEPYMVQLVRLDFGKPCCGPNKPATVTVRVGNNRPDLGTNPICNRFAGFLEEGQPLFLPCNPPMPGAFVSVHLESTAPVKLSLCEAFVYTDQALPIERCPQFRDQPPGSAATYNGKCYVFYSRQPATFAEAAAFCGSRGGSLVSESNPALQGFVSWELWRRHRSDSSGQYWMGAVKDETGGGWRWLGGGEVGVSFWNSPLGKGECARFDGTKGWLWSDTDCATRLNFVCQHQPKACGRPEQPPNSTMVAEDFDVGTTVEYACDDGHLLVGPTSRTCLETGFYNEFPPVCKRIQCGYPADIANGVYSLVNDSVGYLSRVIYECDEGFEMTGRAQLACDIDERWNGPPPRCEPVVCEPPPEIPNGRVESTSNDTSFGSVAKYSCQLGFELAGNAELKCQSNGQYDSAAPICQRTPSTTASPGTVVTEATKTTETTTNATSRAKPIVTTSPAKPVLSIRQRQKTTRAPPTTIRAVETIKKATPTARNAPKTRRPKPTSIVTADHPQDNEIAGSSNVRLGEAPNADVPLPVDGGGERGGRHPFGAKFNIGAVIALGAFGCFVFLAAIATTVVILVRRNRSAKHYRHRASPDCNTVASFDSSDSGSRRGGLNRYYRQAWENLHESASGGGGKVRGGAARSPLEAGGDGSEAAAGGQPQPGQGERKRHHHHHRHRGEVGGGGGAAVGGGPGAATARGQREAKEWGRAGSGEHRGRY